MSNELRGNYGKSSNEARAKQEDFRIEARANPEKKLFEQRTNRGKKLVEPRTNGGELSNEQLVTCIQAGEDVTDNMLRLWQQNQGFITKMARKYSGYEEVEDLKQESYFGLCDAVKHYDPVAGVSFMTYAAFWIRQVIRRYLDNCSGVVRLPVHARDLIRQYKKAVREYEQYYGDMPSDWAICRMLGIDQKRLQAIRESDRIGRIRSLSEPQGEDDLILEDTVASGENLEADVTRRLDTASMKKEIWIAVHELPEEQSRVLQYRYRDMKTLKETGEALGVSLSAARQLESKAVRFLRHPRRCRRFRGYYEEYIAAAPVRHVGVKSFWNTWTSEVERDVLGW